MTALGTYDIALIGVGGTVIGTLIGAWISYKLSIQLADISSKKEATRKIISIFHSELSDVYPYPINWPDNIDNLLRSKFTILNSAVGEFRHCLSKEKQEEYDRAWFNFYNATGREIDNKNCQCYHHYMLFSGTSSANGKEVEHDNTKTYKNNLKKNVDAILEIVKQK